MELAQATKDALDEVVDESDAFKERIAQLEKQMQHSAREMHDRLAAAEKQRVQEVWTMIKCTQQPDIHSTISSSASAAPGAGVAPTQAQPESTLTNSIALLRAQELEKELESYMRSDDDLRSQNEILKQTIEVLQYRISTLEMQGGGGLQTHHTAAEAGNVMSVDTLQSAPTTDPSLQRLERLWDELGVSLNARSQHVQQITDGRSAILEAALAKTQAQCDDLKRRIEQVNL